MKRIAEREQSTAVTNKICISAQVHTNLEKAGNTLRPGPVLLEGSLRPIGTTSYWNYVDEGLTARRMLPLFFGKTQF